MTKKLISMLFVIVFMQSQAHAQIYKCKSSDGSTYFQDKPCQQGDAASVVKQPVYHPSEDAKKAYDTPSSVQSSSGTARYPYAREGDVERLKAHNEELQAMNKKMKEENPNWQHSQQLKNLNDQAEAINKRIQK